MKLAPNYIVWAFMPCSILTHFGTFELLSHIGAALPPGKHDMVRCNMKSGCGGTATCGQIEKLVILQSLFIEVLWVEVLQKPQHIEHVHVQYANLSLFCFSFAQVCQQGDYAYTDVSPYVKDGWLKSVLGKDTACII